MIPYAHIARQSAVRLTELDPSLPVWTERLLSSPRGQERYDADTAIALASLLISIVSTGWTLYRDLLQDRQARKRAGLPVVSRPLIQEILVRVEIPPWLPEPQFRRMTETVAELIERDEDSMAGPSA